MSRSDLFFLFLVGAFLTVLAPYSPELSPDSRAYFSAAGHLLHGDGLRISIAQHAARVYVHWPPLYPMLLAVVHHLTGITLSKIAAALNLAAALTTLTVLARWTRPGMFILAGILFVASPAFIFVYGMAWTELLFTAFVVIFVWQGSIYERKPSAASLHCMIMAAILATLTRYAGITLIPTGLFIIGIRRRYKDALVFLVFASTPIAIWLLRNYALTGTLTGRRAPSSTTMLENLHLTIRVALTMLSPAVLVIVAAWHRIRRADYPATLRVPLLFAGVYLVFLIITSSLFTYDPINLRLLSPLLPVVSLVTPILVTSIQERHGANHANSSYQPRGKSASR